MTISKGVFLLSLLVMTVLACSFAVPGTVMTTPTGAKPAVKLVMTVSPTATPISARVTAMQSLNVRENYGHDKRVVGALYANDLVVMTGNCHGGWAEIVWEDGTAWVNAKFLSSNKCSEMEEQ